MTDSSPLDRQWFVMRDLTRPNVRRPAFRILADAGFEVFTPLATKLMRRGGNTVREDRPLIHDLLFVNASRKELDPSVDAINTLQYRYVKGGGYCEPMTVSAKEMENFMRVVNSGLKVEYYHPDEVSRVMVGSYVRIVGAGPLNGAEGKLISVRGSKKRKLVVMLPGVLSAEVEVSPDFIELID